MRNSLSGGLKKFDSTYSILEKIFTLVAVVSGTTVTVWLSKAQPYLARSGVLGYLIIFMFIVTLFYVLRLLHQSTLSKKAKEEYFSKLTVSSDKVNPLAENFEGKVINLEELRLPCNDNQMHKTFRRCTLVGPMAIMVGGSGGISNSSFNYCGELVALPQNIKGVHLNGVLKFINCTFHECNFIQVTIVVDHKTAQGFKSDLPEMPLIGL
ncbi:hypothetical protein [Pantoea sp. KPR_PJ]|uniref:hypothetical protein n=1 Tax=Pantoea sp. KPR_PJ TaxID=2738375 RepID=UPI003527AB6D